MDRIIDILVTGLEGFKNLLTATLSAFLETLVIIIQAILYPLNQSVGFMFSTLGIDNDTIAFIEDFIDTIAEYIVLGASAIMPGEAVLDYLYHWMLFIIGVQLLGISLKLISRFVIILKVVF